MPATFPRDPWQFAVEPRLTALGLTASDLRWLVEKGYVSHACEVTQPQDVARRFVPARNTAFEQGTCFLSRPIPLGATNRPEPAAAGRICAPARGSEARDHAGRQASACCAGTARTAPWTFGQQIVKRFRRPIAESRDASSRPSRKRAGPAVSTTRFRRP